MHASFFLSVVLTLSIGPERISFEVSPPGPLVLTGRWEGSWSREGDAEYGAEYRDGRLTFPMTPAWTVPFRMVDEGNGQFRARLGAMDVLGIYQRHGDRIVLCFRGAERGYPAKIVDEDRHDVLILHRVRPYDRN